MRKPLNILAVTYWPLDNALISTYTLPYLKLIRETLPTGSQIWLLTLTPAAQRKKGSYHDAHKEIVEAGIRSKDFSYRPFGFAMLVQFFAMIVYLPLFCLFNRIKVVHAWCTPGGALGWIITRFRRARLVLDSFEPHAEAMVETGTWSAKGFSYRLLFWMEKRQLRSASKVICAASGMMDYAISRYGLQKPCFVKPACVDLDKFKPGSKDRSWIHGLIQTDIVCVYAGKFGGIYLEGETFDFFRVAFDHWGSRFKVLLLSAQPASEILADCKRAGFPSTQLIHAFVPHSEIARYMALADFAVCPVKPVPTKRYCSPIKDGEYWALGLPVVITEGISNDSDIIRDNKAGYVLSSLTKEEYAKACREIDVILNDHSHAKHIRELAVKYRSFEIAREIYRTIYA